jgi:GWxTD domain-containing protein
MTVPERTRSIRTKVFLVVLCAAAAWKGGAGAAPAKADKRSRELETILMTDDQLRLFKSLPDEASRRAFIEDFWREKDPDPSTEENEARTEFEWRVRYANKWFSFRDPIRGRDVPGRSHPEDGCLSSRGRIYVLFGPAERMEMGGAGAFGGSSRLYWYRKPTDDSEFAWESWIYDSLKLVINFYRTPVGRWEGLPDSDLAYRIDDAKLNFPVIGTSFYSAQPLKIKAKFESEALWIEIPAKHVVFDDTWKAFLKVTVTVYRDTKKIAELEDTPSFQENADVYEGKKTLMLSIPYRPETPGLYDFVIRIQDMVSRSGTSARCVVRHKQRGTEAPGA